MHGARTPAYGIVAFVVFFMTAGGAALALTELRAELSEHFSPQTPVAGPVGLVGLAVGPMRVAGRDIAADPRDMLVPLSGLSAHTRACIFATTRDGLYGAALRLEVPAAHDEFGLLRPTPDWQHANAVKRRYRRGEFAAVMRVGPDCDTDERADYVPIVYSGGDALLTADVNSHGAPKVFADLGGAHEQIRTLCRRASDWERTTSFDTVCPFTLSPVRAHNERVTLTIHSSALTGPREDVFTVRLP